MGWMTPWKLCFCMFLNHTRIDLAEQTKVGDASEALQCLVSNVSCE